MNADPGDLFFLHEYAVYPWRNLVVGPHSNNQIEPKVMDALCVLIARRNGVLSREEMITKVWGAAEGGDERLTRAISQLRKAFGDNPKSPRFIETVPKRGYRLVCPVTVEPKEVKTDEIETVSEPGAEPALRQNTVHARRPLVFGAAVVFLFIAVVAAIVVTRGG